MIVQIHEELRIKGDSRQWQIQNIVGNEGNEGWQPVKWGAYHATLDRALNKVSGFLFRTADKSYTLPECHDLIEQIVTLLKTPMERPQTLSVEDFPHD